jgi:diacylglycerol kinase family enzyme
VVIGNCQFIGGLRHSPRSFPGDGVLDVLILTGSRSAAFRDLPDMRRGDHVPGPQVVELKGSRIDVEAPGRVPVHVDGVMVGQAPVKYSVAPQALRLKL